jgi:hypothetical protein
LSGSTSWHHGGVRVAAAVIGIIGVVGIGTAIALTALWGSRTYASTPLSADRPIADDIRWWLRLVAVHLMAGVAGGVLVAGLGGRLAMRAIAATSGRAAQGKLTEADEVVGFITVDGTIGFVLFVGIGAGVLSALLYIALRPVLPTGRAGGLLFGAFLLVVAATRLDPLRADNPDFDIVGPDLLSIVIFGALPVLLGTTVAALTARLSAAVPLLSSSPATWLPHLALAPALLVTPVAALIILAGAVTIAARRLHASRPLVPTDRALVASRVFVATIALVALPGFVLALADIAGG